jgi:hypothetical protein
MNKLTEAELSPAKTLAWIQAQVKAPKGNFNAFGKYKYRSAEDILEAVKVVINPIGYYLTISDQVVQLGDRFYVVAQVELTNGFNRYTATAYAREESDKKGMDGAQITGAASSYARKYALSGLFALDDTKDADATNTHDQSDKTDWAVMLAGCKTQADLLTLYELNKREIESSPNIKSKFTKRKQELNEN